MNYSFEYLDIILLAMIAGFIFLRLRGILGKRSGYEDDISNSFPHDMPEMKAAEKKQNYRNFDETGGPEFTEDQVKAIASQFEVNDGPNDDGEMFTRPARPADNFVSPYSNEKAAIAANGGAYPPDMSVLVKARNGGADYIYSLLLGYEDPPSGLSLDDGVYYNKYMAGNKIKMSNPLSDGLVEYGDGTSATPEQMAKDVTTFLAWAAEPHLEARHKIGFRAIIYLIILTILVYFSMKKIWSRVESKV